MDTRHGGDRGRVLLITKTDFTVPRDGGTLRVAAIARSLHAAGFTVDAVPVRGADGADHPVGRARLSAVLRVLLSVLRVGSLSVARWFSPAASTRIAELLRSNDYSAVLIEYSQLLIYRGLVGSVPVVLDMHNIEAELLANYAATAPSAARRKLASYEASRVRRLERRARTSVSAIVTVSARDTELIRRYPGSAPVVTASNGVAESAFGVERVTGADPAIVFIGLLGWQPNVDAAHWLIRHVWPLVTRRRPRATLQLIGRTPAPSLLSYHGVDRISVHPDVESTMPYLSAATVATAPLRAAGGTRLKILEAMATGTPVVATPLGALGLEHLAGAGAMTIADDPEGFADALVDFLDSPRDPALVRRDVASYRWDLALLPLVDAITTAVGRVEGQRR